MEKQQNAEDLQFNSMEALKGLRNLVHDFSAVRADILKIKNRVVQLRQQAYRSKYHKVNTMVSLMTGVGVNEGVAKTISNLANATWENEAPHVC